MKAADVTQRQTVLFLLAIFCVAFLMFFHRSFESEKVLFSNDGPVSALSADYLDMPSAYAGIWNDLNWVGGWQANAPLNLSWTFFWLAGPVLFSKFYVPCALIVLGLCVFVGLRSFGLHPVVALLGAIAGALNTDFFSNGAWGLGSVPLTMAMFFLALAALNSTTINNLIVRAVLAGLAVGMGIMEGFDVGAIMSLFIAAFVVFKNLSSRGEAGDKARLAFVQLLVVAMFAAFISAQSLVSLVSTQISGVAVLEEQEDPQQQWDWATQWSLPVRETFRAVIPGLYGYRMDTENGGEYRGAVGRQPGWEEHRQGLIRHSGTGFYAGVLVVLVGIWAVVQNFRRDGGSPFSSEEKKMIWFWCGIAVVSLLLSYGRHFFLYQLFYQLPFFSTVRNPIKFLHPFSIALIILFAYGLQGLFRLYVEKGAEKTKSFFAHLKEWKSGLAGFEKKWLVGSFVTLGASVLLWLIFVSSNTERVNDLQTVGFARDEATAISAFGAKEFGWFIGFLAVSLAAVLVTTSGWFAGKRAKWAGIVFGLVLVADLGRANMPWIVYTDYKAKYAPDMLSEFLGQDAHGHRVTVWPLPVNEAVGLLQQIYYADWLQHQFPYYNIQCLEFSQEPRAAADNRAFRTAVPISDPRTLPRHWQLTNTRYILGLNDTNFVAQLNDLLDPERRSFEIAGAFDLAQSGGAGSPVKSAHAPDGPFAVIEYKNALPRAKLYSSWSVNTNDLQVLQTLSDPSFSPHQRVFVGSEIPATSSATNDVSGTVEFASYAPKKVVLKTTADKPTVLLLNDKYDENWYVTVDGEQREVLRCNYLMRGVFLEAGEHEVVFRFAPPKGPLFLSLLGILLGVGLCGWVARENLGGREKPKHSGK